MVGVIWWSSRVGQTKFFIDGVEVGSISDHINLEVSSVGNSVNGGMKFSSKMDDFRVYDRSLADDEIISYGNGDGDFGVHTYGEFLLPSIISRLFSHLGIQ